MKEIVRLLAATTGRNHLILRLLIECGLRPGELFATRWANFTGSQLHITEAISKATRGRAIGKTKTPASKNAVALPAALVTLLEDWRHAQKKAQKERPADDAFIFPSRRGTANRYSANYLKRFLKPLAEKLGIPGINYQVFRRTFATHSQRHATIKKRKHGKPVET